MKSFATTRKYVIFLFLSGIVVWLLYAIFHPFEPQYQDKKLTEWAREIDQGDFFRQPAFQLHQRQNEAATQSKHKLYTAL